MASTWALLLPPVSLWQLILTIILLLYIVHCFRSYRKLQHFKGPPLAAFSNSWMIRAAISGQPHLQYADVCRRYGSTSRIGPNTLITCDEELIRKMNAARSPYRRGEWYKSFKFDADIENVFSDIDEERHQKMRQRRAPGYSGKDNPELEASMDETIWSMIRLIDNNYLPDNDNFRRMDFAQIAQYFTLDVITSLSLGQSFGYLDRDEDVFGYVKAMEDNFPITNFLSAVPLLARILRTQLVQRLVLPTVKDKVGMGKIKGVAREIIAYRFGTQKQTYSDMLASFIKHGLTHQEIADESLLQILAGSDTSATVIRMSLLHIITNPTIYSRLVTELTTSPSIPPLSSILTHTTCLQLPYLTACIKEALRICPVATGLMPKIVPSSGDTLTDGTVLPAGTEIAHCAIGVHHNTLIYSPDADIFRPERWLPDYTSPESLARMEKTHELSFGYGRFKCLGERIAKMEIAKCVGELVRRYEWRVCDPLKVLEKNVNMGLFIQKGMWVLAEKRRVRGEKAE